MWASSVLEMYVRGDLTRSSGKSCRGEIPPVHRSEVWRVTDGRCCYCGEQTQPFNTFSIDHFVPLARGGTHQLPNLLPCCVRCNGAKRDRTPEEWLEVRDRLYIVDAAIAYYHAVKRYAAEGLVEIHGDPLWLTGGLIDIKKNGPTRKEAQLNAPRSRPPKSRKDYADGLPPPGPPNLLPVSPSIFPLGRKKGRNENK
jgi:5-methylcytosine-specific restriction endonuclease McrA